LNSNLERIVIIDIHNHYYPPRYLAAVERGGSDVRIAYDDQNRLLIQYPGDYNVVVRGHRDLDERIRAMDANGVNVQAISLTTPGVHVEQARRGIELAQLVNDEFAEATARFPGRFAPLAALPLHDPDASVIELERAVTQLGHRGALLFSNINGRNLDDAVFFPLFEKLAELRVPAFIHPTNPATLGAVADYRLTAIVGFLFDTTAAVMRLVFAGVLERLPELQLVVGHLGGTIPYVAERADRAFEAYDECRMYITRTPSSYFKQLYYDTVNFNPDALRLGLAFAGASHIVFGSDYPHQVGSIGRALGAVRSLELSDGDRNAILGGNAAQLLGVARAAQASVSAPA
jgi:aminocarboxymuconate-semialdehyde decarboxylase